MKLPSTRIHNSLWKAIEEFEKVELLEKGEQEKLKERLNKIPVEVDGEGIKVYINMKYNEKEQSQIKRIASRIIKEKRKEQVIQDKEDEKSFSDSIKIKEATKRFQADYVDFAEDFWKVQPFYYDAAKIWWLWNFKDFFWERMDETDLLNGIYESAKNQGMRITSSSIKSEITTSLKMVGRKHKPIESPNNIIQFKDKIYWIDKDKVRKASPEYFNCNPIPWDVGDSEDTPIMDKIFEDWVGERYVPILYEIIAYCMVQDYPLNRIFCLVGSGSNGKTCFLNLLKKVIGENNCSSTELDRLIKSFGTSVLYKKLVCLMGETNFGLLEKTSILKRISGNDTIDFEFKGKDIFIGKSYAKLIIATNTVPPSTDKTDGFYRRWVLIDFPNKFSEKKEILNDIPEEEYNNLCKKCIGIVKKLLIDRSFTNEGGIEKRKEKYESMSNPLIPFIKEGFKKDINGFIPIYEFFDSFNVYLSKRGLRNVTKPELSKMMEIEGFDKERKDIKDGNGDWKQYWCYIGLGFLTLLTSLTSKSSQISMKGGELKPTSEVSELSENIVPEEEVIDMIEDAKKNDTN